MKRYFEGLPSGVFILDDRFRSPFEVLYTVFFEQKATLLWRYSVIERDLRTDDSATISGTRHRLWHEPFRCVF